MKLFRSHTDLVCERLKPTVPCYCEYAFSWRMESRCSGKIKSVSCPCDRWKLQRKIGLHTLSRKSTLRFPGAQDRSFAVCTFSMARIDTIY